MRTEDFRIENGVLKGYNGPDVEVLEIPEGVTAIGKNVLSYNLKNLVNCKKIIFPSSLKIINDQFYYTGYGDCFNSLEEIVFKGDVDTIGECAFAYIGMYDDPKIGIKSIVFEGHVGCICYAAFAKSRITSLSAPKGIDKLENRVFYKCTKLEEVIIPGLKTIGTECFIHCRRINKLEIPESCQLSDNSFHDCAGLADANGQLVVNGTLFDTRQDIIFEGEEQKIWDKIPAGVTTIDEYAIRYEDTCRIPVGVTTIKQQKDYLKIDYAEGYFKTNKKFSGKGFFNLLENHWINNLSAEDWAYLYLYQSGKNIEKLLSENKKDIVATVQGLIVALNEYGKEKHCVRAAEFILDNISQIPLDVIQKVYDFFSEKKCKEALSLLEPYVGENNDGDLNDPYSEWKAVYIEHLFDKSIKSNRGDNKLFEKVRLAGTNEFAPAFIVKCAIVPYLDQYTGRPKRIGEYKTDYVCANLVELADKAATLLDSDDLQDLVEKEFKKGGSAWLLPYGRYASGAQITSLISNMSKWENWYKYASSGRSDIIIARGGLMLSDTREAMMNLDKKGLLNAYAKLRGTDADSIRDTVLSEFGLDADGKKVYNLGTKNVIASLASDLTLSLFDEVAQKEVKSIPKKGTDPELAEKAAADFAEIKKNAKKIVKGRNDILFEDFLSGKTRPASSWIASYTKNPLLKRVAELIVWVQGKDTFILTENGAVDCSGAEYIIDENTAIGVAHPLEMKHEEVKSWQNYFISHGLKQPFSQIWEPVIDESTIEKDRYAGCMIPFYRFRSQGKHGISVEDCNFHSEIYITFAECDAYVERIDWRRHEINNEDNFEVKSFGFEKYTRRVNHIVAYLDNVTVIGKILKDDTSIASILPQFTVAQITEYIRLASENDCVAVTALLLEFQQKQFSDFDPMAEFTLE